MSSAEPQEKFAPEPKPDGLEIQPSADDRQWGMFCHLSALLGLFVAGMTFIGPLVCWLIKKDQSKFVDYHGKEALNFQLNILVYTLIAVAITFATCGIAFPVIFIPLICGIVLPIIAGVKANAGEYYQYPATFRIIR